MERELIEAESLMSSQEMFEAFQERREEDRAREAVRIPKFRDIWASIQKIQDPKRRVREAEKILDATVQLSQSVANLYTLIATEYATSIEEQLKNEGE